MKNRTGLVGCYVNVRIRITDGNTQRAYLMAAIKHPGGTAADTSWVDAAKRAARRVDLASMMKNARFLTWSFCAK